MAYKFLMTTQENWRGIIAPKKVKDLSAGQKIENGLPVKEKKADEKSRGPIFSIHNY